MNTATLYDLTKKEYLSLGKVGDGFFGVSDKAIVAFLTRVKNGHDIKICYDSKGEPDGFYDENESTEWKEIVL